MASEWRKWNAYLIFYVFLWMRRLFLIAKIIDTNDTALLPYVGQCQLSHLDSPIRCRLQCINIDVFWLRLFVWSKIMKRKTIFYKQHFSFNQLWTLKSAKIISKVYRMWTKRNVSFKVHGRKKWNNAIIVIYWAHSKWTFYTALEHEATLHLPWLM